LRRAASSRRTSPGRRPRRAKELMAITVCNVEAFLAARRSTRRESVTGIPRIWLQRMPRIARISLMSV
jgi:hypothetical protein